MDFNVRDHLPENFDPSSRVWIYQSSRLFFIAEAFQLEDMLKNFVSGWNSHGAPVKGYANLFFGRFIVFMADERATGVSGCSTDSSVQLIRDIEKTFKVDMFNRLLLTFIINDKIEQLPLSQFGYALSNGFITPETLFFNNTVLTKKELEENWIIQVRESWLQNRLIKQD